MKVVADLCLVPLGVGVSVSPYIVACQRVLQEAGLQTRLHAYGTNIEGEWETVLGAVRRCHEVVHEMGAPRISTTLKLGTRTDRDQGLADKVQSVVEKLEQRPKRP
ncbi:MAG: MTH1187 family thiamine-binding protein [Phycisphaerae bacterium]|nr:MTH1187 family thiamine-binding protein [Phycisphaerae bacterium]